jgi:predicted metal-dependent HD superfamily phosphohydrolase
VTRLLERWAALVAPWGAGDAVSEVGEAIVARYAEPHRRYHTVAHLDAVVGALFLDLADDPVAVELAAFFHDAVYDPGAAAGDNERRSAALAGAVLAPLGAPRATVTAVARLVLTTADHTAHGDVDAGVLNDADLAVLGAPAVEYDAYVRAVRAEYGWLDEQDWRLGRRAVLAALLDRPSLYATERGRGRWEARARDNVASELLGLRDDPAGPSPSAPA